MPYLIARRLLALKLEAVEGVAEAPGAPDVLPTLMEPEWVPTFNDFPQEVVQPSFSKITHVSGEKSALIRWATPLKGSGAAGTPPPSLSVPFQICGLGETIVGGVSVTYAPVSDSIPSATALLQELFSDGTVKEHLVVGCRGNMSLEGVKGVPTLARFEIQGRYNTPTETGAALATPSPGVVPPPLLNASFAFHGAGALKVQNISLDMQNEIVMQNDPNEEHGNFMAVYVDRNPIASIDPEQVKIATMDFFNLLETNAEGALSYVLGSVAGNIVTITAPKTQPINISPADREKIRTEGLDLAVNENSASGDDEFSIAMT